MFGSANPRRATLGADAAEFRLDRDPGGHLPFDGGFHYCLDAVLTRAESKVAGDVVLSRTRGFRRNGGCVQRIKGYAVRGCTPVPISFVGSAS